MNHKQLRSGDDPVLQYDDPRALAARAPLDYSMLLPAQLARDQSAYRDTLYLFLQELNSAVVVAPDVVKHEGIAILSRRIGAFALDNEIRFTTEVAHLNETG